MIKISQFFLTHTIQNMLLGDVSSEVWFIGKKYLTWYLREFFGGTILCCATVKVWILLSWLVLARYCAWLYCMVTGDLNAYTVAAYIRWLVQLFYFIYLSKLKYLLSFVVKCRCMLQFYHFRVRKPNKI